MELPGDGEVNGLALRSGVGDLDLPVLPCLFFTALCHFFKALDVCSSNTVFFIVEPICK